MPSERDPRVQPGVVLRVDAVNWRWPEFWGPEIKVVDVQPTYVEVEFPLKPNSPCKDRTTVAQFRRWAAGATVVRKGE